MSDESMLTGTLIRETSVVSLGDLSRACGEPADWVLALVEEGVIEPQRSSSGQWTFDGQCLRRAVRVHRLQRDLGINLSGAALALELLDEVEILRRRIQQLERIL